MMRECEWAALSDALDTQPHSLPTACCKFNTLCVRTAAACAFKRQRRVCYSCMNRDMAVACDSNSVIRSVE